MIFFDELRFLHCSYGTFGQFSSYLAGGDVVMAGPSFSPGKVYNLFGYMVRDKPEWTLLDDPCLRNGEPVKACEDKEEFGWKVCKHNDKGRCVGYG